MTDKMKKLEIYIHIPFCVKKCAYCDFLSGPAGEEERRRYVQALKKEIKSCREDAKGYLVQSVFFGGGTPSILEPEEISEILDTVKAVFQLEKKAEITMEQNPGTAEAGKMRGYLDAGVNRLSIGLQSADDKELAILGRIHTYRDFVETYQAARNAGFDNINVDLMSAVPGQTMESYRETLKKVTALKPEHISAYSLIIEEGTLFWNWYGEGRDSGGHPPVPDEDTDRAMYEETKRFLKEYGYERYEISNYAKEGFACRHNIGYWNRTPYLGFGVGAASFFEGARFSNLRDREAYTKLWLQDNRTSEEKKRIQREDWHKVSKKEAEEEFFFLGLRMMEGVREDVFEKTFGIAPRKIYGEQIKTLQQQKLLQCSDGRIFLTERGIDVSNYVMAQFLQEE